MTNKTILKRIANTSPAFRMLLAKECKKHSEKQCNGEYYYDDEKAAWVGYDGRTHATDNAQAKEGKAREKDIIAKILKMTGTKTIPVFLDYNDDVRGFVIKIHSDKLTTEEQELCRTLDLAMDWGHDFAIVKDSEWN